MHVINVADVNEALPRAMAYLRDCGRPEATRNGPALAALCPVATVYRDPRRRVLFDPERDANPFFHLFEALWILAGRRDVLSLCWYNARMTDYSDDKDIFHGAYGFRLRSAFGIDQLEIAAHMLRDNNASRQVVLQIWDARLDLGANSKDMPCNDMVMLRIRADTDTLHPSRKSLDITVCNRSNDIVWGAYGANAVQFSVLQEYLANKIGVGVGTYTQMSNNLHVYTDLPYWQSWLEKHASGVFVPPCAYDLYEDTGADISLLSLEEASAMFDKDLYGFFDMANYSGGPQQLAKVAKAATFNTQFFNGVVKPMVCAHANRGDASALLDPAIDWHRAGLGWIDRRKEKQA